VLRCIERVEARQIRHIPRVLYHWRVHGESTAKSMQAKPYAAVAGERALNEHFARTGVQAKAEYLGYGFRARYALPPAPPLVSLIIPTRNEQALVRQCVESIEAKTDYANHEIILVDNGSDDPAALDYFRQLGQQPGVRVIRDGRPFNYSALNNAAVELASGELVGLVNNDIEVISPDWLSEMVAIGLRVARIHSRRYSLTSCSNRSSCERETGANMVTRISAARWIRPSAMATRSESCCIHSRSSSQPMTPKSTQARVPPRVTIMLDACGSAWNKPCRCMEPNWNRKTISAMRSFSAWSRSRAAANGSPSMNSCTRTRFVPSSG